VVITVFTTVADVRQFVSGRRAAGRSIGLVPTMGALHAGHGRLMEQARAECGCVVASIFVNPLQFDRADDLAKYPRTLDADLALCASLGVDAVFAPAVEEMYPSEQICTIDVGRLADHLGGKFRPGHFRGVATVVMKLLQMVQAVAGYFGEKDAQQLAIIRRLVTDFAVPVRIVGVPTVREEDGLALSSRNRRLNVRQRRLATSLYAALREADAAIASGVTSADEIRRRGAECIPVDEELRLEYLEIVDRAQMQPVARVDGPVLIAGALWVGNTRLIDNILSNGPVAA
jgi:pantoate--beta-alanine ligase